MHFNRNDVWLWISFSVLIGGTGCQTRESPDGFVARVGDSYLLNSDIEASLLTLNAGVDSLEARKQIIDQWVNNELLYQEAIRLRLASRDHIRRRLDESARAVLTEGLISEYHDHADSEITSADIMTYYENNKEYLRFFEPFVRIRYLNHSSRDSLEVAMQLLNEETTDDSVFVSLISRFGDSPDELIKMTEDFQLETHLFHDQPELNNLLVQLTPGNLPVLVQLDSMYHLIQVLDRSPTGAVPELPWIEDFIREQLMIRNRKQNYLRSVQTLRVEAQFKEEIEIR